MTDFPDFNGYRQPPGFILRSICRCDPIKTEERDQFLTAPRVCRVGLRLNGREVNSKLVLVCPRCRSMWDAPE